jgi:nucleotide-binding universal stress UspA family protein
MRKLASRNKKAPCVRHVLFADDGSEGAARARDFAVRLAAATGAGLTAAYVREPTESAAAAARKLERSVAAAAAAGARCETDVLPPVGLTSPGRRIVTAAKRHGADIIVVGARGYGLARKVLGSVSSYVVTHAPISVTVVR